MKQLNIKKSVLIIYLAIILLIAVRYIYAWYRFNNIYLSDNKNKYIEVMIETLNSKSNDKVEYLVKLNNDKFLLNIYNSSYSNKERDILKYSNYKYKDIVKVNGRIKIPEYYQNIAEFNYKKYLNSKNIYGYITCYLEEDKDIITINKNSKNTIIKRIYDFKEYISKCLDENLGSEAALTKSIIYGDTSNLTSETYSNFKKLGISHVLSVSGSNIATITLVLGYLNIKVNDLNKIKKGTLKYRTMKLKNYISAIIILSVILAFNIISAFELSIIRSSIMITISIISKLLKDKKTNIYNSLFISFLAILLVHPFAIFNVGLNLSFLATLGIILFQSKIYNCFEHLLKKLWTLINRIIKTTYLKIIYYKQDSGIKNKCEYGHKYNYIKKTSKFNVFKKILNYVLLITSITISAQILILPLQIETFNEIPLNILISNIIVSIFDTAVRLIGIFGIMFSFFKPVLDFLFKCIIPFSYTLEKLVTYMAKNARSINVMSLPTLIYFEYYLIILNIYMYFNYKRTETNTRAIKKEKIKVYTTFIIFLISLTTYITYKYNSNYITFFNVGQGDMAYIKYKNKSILIDCGSKTNKLAASILESYFKSQNIKKIDLIIISHFHEDHVNGIKDILETLKINKIICAYQENIAKEDKNIYESYIEIKKYALSKNILFNEVKKDQTVLIGDININILSPNINEIFNNDNINASSLVCNINIKNNNYLFMGDATSYTENRILNGIKQNNLKVDVLKVGHHGSKNATTNEFIQLIKPSIGIITAKKKYYGHPSENTIQILNNNNVKIFKTETLGQIKFKIR